MGNESSSARKTTRSRKKRNSPQEIEISAPSSSRSSNENRGKPTPPDMQTSVESFDRASYPNKNNSRVETVWDPGIITDGITNVKERYHINPQE